MREVAMNRCEDCGTGYYGERKEPVCNSCLYDRYNGGSKNGTKARDEVSKLQGKTFSTVIEDDHVLSDSTGSNS